MRLLIPNDITISEQFTRLTIFNNQFQQWYLETYLRESTGRDISTDVIDQFEVDSGIRCSIKNYSNKLLSPRIVDERKYVFFTLKYHTNLNKPNFKI